MLFLKPVYKQAKPVVKAPFMLIYVYQTHNETWKNSARTIFLRIHAANENPSQLAEAQRALFSKPVYKEVKPDVSCYKPVKAPFALAYHRTWMWSRGLIRHSAVPRTLLATSSFTNSHSILATVP